MIGLIIALEELCTKSRLGRPKQLSCPRRRASRPGGWGHFLDSRFRGNDDLPAGTQPFVQSPLEE